MPIAIALAWAWSGSITRVFDLDFDVATGLLRVPIDGGFLTVELSDEDVRTLLVINAEWPDLQSVQAGTAVGHAVCWATWGPDELRCAVSGPGELWGPEVSVSRSRLAVLLEGTTDRI